MRSDGTPFAAAAQWESDDDWSLQIYVPGGGADAAGCADDDAGEGAIPARVLAVTPLHEKAVLLLQLADGTEWLAAQPPDTLQGAAGDAVFVRFATEAALLFDRASGLRVGLPQQRQAA